MWPNLINMLSWWQWALLAAVPPAIISLYFLKLRREPLEVPSTYLWHKSIEDLHVNSIWQRLRQNLLLLLQLLLVLLAMLALLRPSWRSSVLKGDRFIFVVDNSASMSAKDVKPSRLEEAKRQVLALIDQMRSGDKAMIISFNSVAQVVEGFTDNRRQLRRRLQTISPSDRPTSLLEALKLAAGLANPGRMAVDGRDISVAKPLPAHVYIYSDGKFDDVRGFSLGYLEPFYVPLGQPDASNLAVTALTTRRHEVRVNQLQAFGQVENFGPANVTVAAELFVDDESRDFEEFGLKPGETQAVVFDLGEMSTGVIRLQLRAMDALAVDDVAYAAVNPRRRGRVLYVGPGNNEALLYALSTPRSGEFADVTISTPEELKTKQYREAAAAGAYDLVIYDQCRPEVMPQANTLFIGQLPPLDAWYEKYKPSGETAKPEPPVVENPQIIDTELTHPLMQLLEFGDVLIAESLALEPPPGSTVLIDSSRGALFAIAPREGFEDAVLGFGIVVADEKGAIYANTDWPRRLSFPTFVFNLLSYLGGQPQGGVAGSARPGEAVQLRSQSPVEELEVRDPGGNVETVLRGKRNTFQFNRTDRVGVYEVREAGKLIQQFTVNLFDRLESNIAPRPAIDIDYVKVVGEAGWEPARRESWKLLLGAALVVLLLEWYIYNRRVYV